MFRHRRCELVVRLDKCKKCVFIWWGIIGVYIALHRPRRRLAPLHELFDQFIPEDFGWW